MGTTALHRVQWQKDQHERRVEKFYSTGVKGIHEYHGGYLNFGWWEHADNYREAAETLVYKIGKACDLDKKSKVLDVACGMAPQNIFLHKMFGAAFDCVDVTWKHVEIARKRVESAGLTDAITIHHGSATSLIFDDDSFDSVISIEGPEHFNTREDFFREAFRVLKTGGVLSISDFSLKRPPETWMEKTMLRLTQILWQVPKANVYTTHHYRSKLESAGFKNISIKECGKHVIPGYVYEQWRLSTMKELSQIRGWFAAIGGLIIDYLMLKIFRSKLVEYILVRAEKQSQ